MIKIAINGFGRIGRHTLKNILEKYSNLEIVAINDLTDSRTIAHLLKYDSLYGIYDKSVEFKQDSLSINNKEIKIFNERNPEKLPWKKLSIDIVLECTGVFRDLEGARKHLKAGAKKVIISSPSKSDKIPSFVLGVNQDKFNVEKDDIIDMGSCTTNCLAPIAKILNDEFKIVKGFMTTIHSYTNNQRLLDSGHKDLRRARSAAENIIPTTTGAATAINKVIPELKDRLDGSAIRIPLAVVSFLELVCEVEKKTNKQEVNSVFEKASKQDNFDGIFRIENNPLVSSDYKKDSYSCILDTDSTKVIDNLIKVGAWYDNEWAYACRLADFANLIAEKI